MNPAEVAEFIASELTSGGRVRLHVAPQVVGCQVPVTTKSVAILEFGISGVLEGGHVDGWGISAEIWFGGKDGEYHQCRMPWGAVLAVTDEDNQGLFADRQYDLKATHKHLARIK